jgi:hypothetical protein
LDVHFLYLIYYKGKRFHNLNQEPSIDSLQNNAWNQYIIYESFCFSWPYIVIPYPELNFGILFSPGCGRILILNRIPCRKSEPWSLSWPESPSVSSYSSIIRPISFCFCQQINTNQSSFKILQTIFSF